MKCEYCKKALKKGDDYIEYERERYCGDCYEAHTFTDYSVGGQFLAAEDDGIIEYDKYSQEDE